MLSDRERRTLATIEHHLVESDPELVRLFAAGRPTGPEGMAPTFLLVIGLVLMVLGSAIVAVPLALTGMAVASTGLIVAHGRPVGPGRPSPA